MWSTSAPDAIDLAVPGKRCFHVRLTYRQDGRDEELLLPLVIVSNGRGPTVLVAGGTHGDEFEGQIAVAHLCRQIERSRRARHAPTPAFAQRSRLPGRHAHNPARRQRPQPALWPAGRRGAGACHSAFRRGPASS